MPIRQFTLTDLPKRKESVPQNETQSAIEEAFSFDGPPDAMITVAGKVYLYFGGNGYLGLQANPEVLAATCEAVLRYGVGTATMRTAFTSPPVFEVERRIAEMFGTEQTLYTSSGYAANQILLESLEKTFDRIFIDEAAHYSLFNAANRTRKNQRQPIAFQHGDTDDLKDKLERNLQLHEKPLVITDGVFAQHATIAPLDEYTELLSHYNGASLWIDDAHGFGILGNTGLGTLEYLGLNPAAVNRTNEDSEGDEFGLENEVSGMVGATTTAADSPVKLYLTLSLSKAAGGCGGIISGSRSFIQRIKDRSALYFSGSAPATPIAAATAKALAILAEDTLRERLHRNVMLLKKRLRDIGLETDASPLPIIVFTVGSAGNMRRIQKGLAEKGILVSYLPRNTAIGSQGAIRLAVFATHNEEMLTELTDALAAVL